MAVTLAAPLVCTTLVSAADTRAGYAGGSGQLICLAEQPAIVEGEIAMLRAWVTTSAGQRLSTPINFTWHADAGRIEAQTSATRWDLSAVKVQPGAGRKVTATVQAAQSGRSPLHCVVEVFIGEKDVTIPNRGAAHGESLISARRFLLPGDTPEPGYGLYSYVLFSAPPKDAEEKARYLSTVSAYLQVIQDVEDYLRRHVPPSALNATFIPLKKTPDPGKSNEEWASNVLAEYDYAAAQILLSKLRQAGQDGPYLVSVTEPLSESGVSVYLWQDLTGVAPELARDWIKYFTFLAAQQRVWSEVSLRRFGLTLHNLIAVGGKVTPDVMEALDKAIQVKSKIGKET
jgi:hypothetical protein